MVSTELRIGNLFLEKNSQTEIKVLELSETNIVFEGDFKGEWQAEAIPLNNKSLLKLGFKITDKNEEITWYSFDGFDITFNTDSDTYYIVYSDIVLKHIKSVHQLQNLYFALTNTEL